MAVHTSHIPEKGAADGLATLDSGGKIPTGQLPSSVVQSGSAAGGDLAGTYPNPTVAQSSTAFALTGVISPSQITSNQDDYNPTGLSTASTLRLSSDASRDITGLAGGATGRLILIHNVGANPIVLKDEGSGSAAANRFALTADVTLSADSMCFLHYDNTTQRWRSTSGGGGGGAPSGPAGGDLGGTYPNPTVAQSSTAFALAGVISPSSIGADQNDYNPTGLSTANTIRLTASTPGFNITGLQGGATGRILKLHNIGSFPITLVDESGSSSAANRFALISNLALSPDDAVELHYDNTTQRWRAVTASPVMVGDSGSGGVKGLVPAPASGNAAAGKFLKADGTWAVPSDDRYWIAGFEMIGVGGETGVHVYPGRCVDTTGVQAMELTDADGTFVDSAVAHSSSNGLPQANGMDEIGLDNLASNPITCSQTTTTITASASILTHIPTRSITGTVSSSGTTVTGTGTQFLKEIAIDDVIGNSTVGYSRVTAIASDTSLTLTLAFPGGNASGGSTILNLDAVGIRPAAGVLEHVRTISSAGTAIVVATSASHAASSALTIGGPVASAFYWVYVVHDGTSTSTTISARRSRPFAATLKNWKFRSIAAVRLSSSVQVYSALQSAAPHRFYGFQQDPAAAPWLILSAGTATSWTVVTMNDLVPHGMSALQLRLTTGNTTRDVVARPRSVGASAVSKPFIGGRGANATNGFAVMAHRGYQSIEYTMSGASGSGNIAVVGWAFQELLH